MYLTSSLGSNAVFAPFATVSYENLDGRFKHVRRLFALVLSVTGLQPPDGTQRIGSLEITTRESAPTQSYRNDATRVASEKAGSVQVGRFLMQLADLAADRVPSLVRSGTGPERRRILTVHAKRAGRGG